MNPAIMDRNERVLQAAMHVAAAKGYKLFTREDVAERAGVATGTVNTAFQTMGQLRQAVMARAVRDSVGAVLAQGLVDKHPLVEANSAARQEALRYVLEDRTETL